jgi:hypothetical protein
MQALWICPCLPGHADSSPSSSCYQLSHSINAIDPAPHWSGRKREHRSCRLKRCKDAADGQIQCSSVVAAGPLQLTCCARLSLRAASCCTFHSHSTYSTDACNRKRQKMLRLSVSILKQLVCVMLHVPTSKYCKACCSGACSCAQPSLASLHKHNYACLVLQATTTTNAPYGRSLAASSPCEWHSIQRSRAVPAGCC